MESQKGFGGWMVEGGGSEMTVLKKDNHCLRKKQADFD